MSDNPTKEFPEGYLYDQIQSLTQDVREVLQIVTVVSRVQNEMAERLSALETTVDQRLKETRPIWEAMQAQLDEVIRGIANLNRKVDVLHGDIVQTRADQRHLEERVDDLQKKVS